MEKKSFHSWSQFSPSYAYVLIEDPFSDHIAVDLAEKYLQSQQYKELRSAIDPIHDAPLEEEKTTGKLTHRQRSSVSYPRNFFWQVLIARNLIKISLHS